MQNKVCIGMRKLRECSLSESPERPLESPVRTRERAVSACLFYPEIFRAQNRSSCTTNNRKLQVGSPSCIPSEFSTLQSMAIQIIAKQKEIQNTTQHQNGFSQWRRLSQLNCFISSYVSFFKPFQVSYLFLSMCLALIYCILCSLHSLFEFWIYRMLYYLPCKFHHLN